MITTAVTYVGNGTVITAEHGNNSRSAHALKLFILIGLLMGLAQRHQWLSPSAMALLVTGFCGAFTTFSTFANELVTAGTGGHWLTAAAYLAASLAGGLLMVLAGRSLATLI